MENAEKAYEDWISDTNPVTYPPISYAAFIAGYQSGYEDGYTDGWGEVVQQVGGTL